MCNSMPRNYTGINQTRARQKKGNGTGKWHIPTIFQSTLIWHARRHKSMTQNPLYKGRALLCRGTPTSTAWTSIIDKCDYLTKMY